MVAENPRLQNLEEQMQSQNQKIQDLSVGRHRMEEMMSHKMEDDVSNNEIDESFPLFMKVSFMCKKLGKPRGWAFGNKEGVTVKNVSIKGKNGKVNEEINCEKRDWNHGDSLLELRYCNHIMLKENAFDIRRRQKKKMRSLSMEKSNVKTVCENAKVNCKGAFVATLSGYINVALQSRIAEAYSLLEALSWLIQNNISMVKVEMDCQELYFDMNSSNMDLSEFGLIVSDCKFLLSQGVDITVN
ncbi:hypothetical protein GH714_037103 [Hevea brasiliensis]|uniref:RNase H type-1 domain-containing protein n=1 Tax=Hevea brasiliensis TaxID=3981 RepID=A0A6A6M7J2_HEVBR|nr:hypothetical protein GH714_037103 [Hevea brasiliensis]